VLTARAGSQIGFWNTRPMGSSAGEFLKKVRSRLQLGVREVQQASAVIASDQGNPSYYIAASRLTQIENNRSIPGVFKLFSLCAIYGLDFYDLLRRYGVDADKARSYGDRFFPEVTRPALAEVHGLEDKVPVPIRLDPSFSWETTQLVNRVVALWGAVPAAFLAQCNPHRQTYAYIGLADMTMYPLIRPGSFIMIDPERRRVTKEAWKDEFQRPIYFIELRNGYRCGWCQVDGSRLVLISHPHSGEPVRSFSLAFDADIVGQVVGVAVRLAPANKPIPEPARGFPKPIEIAK